MSELYSHPNKRLEVHLRETAELCKKIVESTLESTSNFNNDPHLLSLKKDTLPLLAFITGAFHDIAKSTKQFQQYIKKYEKDEKSQNERNNKDDFKKAEHSYLSAILAYEFTKKYVLKDIQLDDDNLLSFLEMLPYLAIRRHHTNFRDISTMTSRDSEIYYLESTPQLYEMPWPELKNIYIDLLKGTGIDVNQAIEELRNLNDGAINEIINEIHEKLEDFADNIESFEKDLSYFFLLRLFSSALLYADRISAADLFDYLDIRKNRAENELDLNKFINYRKEAYEGKNKTYLNKLREETFKEVDSKIDKLQFEDSKILMINLPTGIGKTDIGINVALKLKNKFKLNKIIYALPFLSIVDQVADKVKKIYPDEVTRYDHITSPEAKDQNKNSFNKTEDDARYESQDSLNKAQADVLYEGWDDPFIVTTFVSLFDVIIKSERNAIIKFHKLANSVIILDEIQAIPIKYYGIISKNLNWLSKHLNTFFIIMTATDPGFIDNVKKIDLASDLENSLKSLNRYKIIYSKDVIDLETLFERVEKDLNRNENKHIAIVLNTKQEAIDTFTHFKRVYSENENVKVFFLAANMTPHDREKVLKEIKDAMKDPNGSKKVLLISTQVIEAGVDLDFDMIYRDFAPLDSIIQTAGRCNRNFYQDKKGIINLVKIEDKEKSDNKIKLYCKEIYDYILLDNTESVLENKQEIEENTVVYELLPHFFQLNYQKKESSSSDLIKLQETLKLLELTKEFSLIEKDYNTMEILILNEEEAENIRKNIKNLIDDLKKINKEEKFKVLSEIKANRKKLENYIVSIQKEPEFISNSSEESWDNYWDEELNCYVYEPDQLSEYVYDEAGLHKLSREEKFI